MATTKKKKSTPRRRRFYRKIRRRMPKRFSIIQTASLAGGVVSSMNARNSIGSAVYGALTNAQTPESAMRDVFVQLVGYDYINKSWHVPTFTAMAIGGSLASKVVGKFVPPSTFNAIPYIGKKLKM